MYSYAFLLASISKTGIMASEHQFEWDPPDSNTWNISYYSYSLGILQLLSRSLFLKSGFCKKKFFCLFTVILLTVYAIVTFKLAKLLHDREDRDLSRTEKQGVVFVKLEKHGNDTGLAAAACPQRRGVREVGKEAPAIAGLLLRAWDHGCLLRGIPWCAW